MSTINLHELILLKEDEQLFRKYANYRQPHLINNKIRLDEIKVLEKMIIELQLTDSELDGFYYGYVIPHLDKEIDLIKIGNDYVLNIEMKSTSFEEKIKKQLQTNRYFLKMIKKQIISIAYQEDINQFYILDDEKLVKTDALIVKKYINELEGIDVNLDDYYKASTLLVSPLNNTEKFINDEYLLTQHQMKIKSEIHNNISEKQFYGITGGPGTGKSLLIYDIAKEGGKKSNVLVIHCGMLCPGHLLLDEKLYGVDVIPIKDLNRIPDFSKYDIVLVDECQRIYIPQLDKIIQMTIDKKNSCIFSFDLNQRLSQKEVKRNVESKLNKIFEDRIYKLTNKIRTNQKLSYFIDCLFDKRKNDHKTLFDDVKIIYENDERKAHALARRQNGYSYIRFTPSRVNSALNYQISSDFNTHQIIGQEFDNVVMLLNRYFHYTDKGQLVADPHPNPDYMFTKMLYQGLTRAREKIILIVTRPAMLNEILELFYNGSNYDKNE